MLGKFLGTELNYKLSHCKTCAEAERLLKLSHYPYLDFVIADREGEILYFHNACEKTQRDQQNHYANILTINDFEPLDKAGFYENNFISVSNPQCGFIVSANQSPFHVTESDTSFTKLYKGLLYFNDNSRSKRIKAIISSTDKISVKDLKEILFDTKIELPIIRGIDFSEIYTMKSEPCGSNKISKLIEILNQWDGTAYSGSEGAAVFALMFYIYHKRYYTYSKNPDVIRKATTKDLLQCLEWVAKYYNIGETLKDIQYLKRESFQIPIQGIPDSINTVRAYFDKGKLYAEEASAFRMIIDLKQCKIYTCHPFGTSANNDSEHFTDQSELFISNKYKTYNLNQ